MYRQLNVSSAIAPSILTINPTPSTAAAVRVAAYCRVSTSQAAQLESIRAQKEHYEYICSGHKNWNLVNIYIEEGLSGTSAQKRPELIRMIRDCTAGKIDLIITKSISRLARNTTDCLEITRMLTGLGVQVFFEREQIRTGTTESELMLSILASLAEDESHSISDNNKWNCRNRFRTGTYKFSNVPFGYRLNGQEITIDPDEAKVIRFIFDEAHNGSSCGHIARELSSQKILRQKSKGQWDSAYINKILRNPFYKGCVLHQKTYTDQRFCTHINRGEEDRYFINNHHIPIISSDIFDDIQTLLDQKNKRSSKKEAPLTSQMTSRSCLSGKLFCTCGSSYRRITNGKNKKQYLWSCGRHLQRAQDCPSLRLPEESIMNAFTTMLNKLDCSKDTLLEPYICELKNELDEKHPERQDILDEERRIQNQLTELNRQRIENGIHPTVFYSKKNSLLARSNEIARKKACCLTDLECLTEAEDLLKYLTRRTDKLTFDSSAFERFVDHIQIKTVDHTAQLTFHLTCCLNLTETIVKEMRR